MTTCRTIDDEGDCSFSCARCALQYALEPDTSSRPRRDSTISDEKAARNIQEYMHSCKALRDGIQGQIMQRGNLIISRWKKLSKEKRKAVILQAAPFICQHQHNLARQLCGLPNGSRSLVDITTPYLNLDSLTDDPARLLRLCHHRAFPDLEEWVPFDTSQFSLACELIRMDAGSNIKLVDADFNMHCVVMQGERLGELTPYVASQCHSLEVVGYPIAELMFRSQRALLSVLFKTLAQVVESHQAHTGHDRWDSLVANDFRLSNGHNPLVHFASPFARPPVFDPVRCLQEVRAHLSAAEDRLTDLQTDAEYFHAELRRYRNKMPASDKVRVVDQENVSWFLLGHHILFGMTGKIRILRCLEKQCRDVLQFSNTSLSGSSPMLEGYKEAMTALWKTAFVYSGMSKLSLRRLLVSTPGFSSLHGSSDEEVGTITTKGSKVARLFHTDRLCWYIAALCSLPTRLMSTDEAFYLACIDEHMDKASVQERSRIGFEMYTCIEMTAIFDQIETSIALAHPFMLPAGDLDRLPDQYWESVPRIDLRIKPQHVHEAERKQMATALRRSYENPWPRGPRDTAWLSKADESRRLMSEFWAIARKVYKRTPDSLDPSWPRAINDIACLNADCAPEFLNRVDEERADVLQRIASKSQRPAPASNAAPTQTIWGEEREIAKYENANTRTKQKTRPADAVLGGNSGYDLNAIAPAPEVSSTKISVNAESLRLFARLFSPGNEPLKGVIKWQQVVTALSDAGLLRTSVGGSAVSFRLLSEIDEGTIVFHKPHPEPNVDLIMQRVMGKRLHKHFGWTAETFIERKKSVADDKVAENEGVRETED